MAGASLPSSGPANLLRNGDFSQQAEGGGLAEWTVGGGESVSVDRELPPGQAGGSLRVVLSKDGGGSYGEVYQNVKAAPRTLYRLEGRLRSSKPGFAFLWVKLRQGGKEIQRIALSQKSQTEWTTASLEFSSGQADEIQVLCRWERNAARGWLGSTGWFAGLRLVEAGAAPPPPPWTEAIARAGAVKPPAGPVPPLKRADADLFITPDGAGRRDGTDWDNALSGNAPGTIQAAWDALAPGRACRVGSGVYAGVSLAVATGGTGPDRMKRLIGQDTGAGLPWFVGDWQPSRPAGGMTFLSLREAVGHCSFENLQLARYQFGVLSGKGGHVGLRFRNCGLYEFRYGIYLNGLAYADKPEAGSHDIEIADCRFVNFPKSAVRLQGGNYDVRVINCLADTGGRDWMLESFQIAYLVAGDSPRQKSQKDDRPWAGDHDILFINCVARNAIWAKDRYWQGDGFCAERGVRNLAFINCSAFDNADGGWDVKSDNVIYVNCVSLRNKMNYRVWQHAFMHNCLSAGSHKHGGSWTTAGLWTTGEVRSDRGTFHNNSVQQILADQKEHGEAKVTLEGCLVSCDGVNAQAERLIMGEQRVTRTRTVMWQGPAGGAPTLPAGGAGADAGGGEPRAGDPQYVSPAAAKTWLGEPADAFDSRRYGPAQGYHSTTAARWRSQTPDQLVRNARLLLQCRTWEDFLRGIADCPLK